MTLRIRVLPRFPANISGENGIAITRDGLDLIVGPDCGSLVQAPSVIDAEDSFFTVWRQSEDFYIRMTFNDVLQAFTDLGEVTPSDGSVTTAKIVDRAVTPAKAFAIATSRLVGRTTAGSGDQEEISVGAGLTLSAGSLVSLSPFTKSFESAEQTITSAGLLTLAHGLAVKPKIIFPVLVCKTAEAGYSVGDEIPANLGVSNSAADNFGASIETSGTTNILVRFGSNATVFSASNKTSGAGATLTNANWRLVIRAWA